MYENEAVDELPARSQARTYIVCELDTEIFVEYKVPDEQSAGAPDVEYLIESEPDS
ncbi:MAG: hypothetical protein NTX85_02110 [Candidatus Nomurabacteria bacterium]|nr:hypothetical protein [Candidatus Nomurabacteria bacterium]